MNVNYIRFYQTPNEEFSYSFTTPLYMNLNEPSPYEKYGLYSTASLSIDGTDIGTYNYAADGIYKEFQTVVPSITSRLSITNGELGILYGKDIDDSTNSFIITSDEVFNSNSLVVNNLIWSEKKVQVHANANSQFQQKDYIIYSGFEPGGSITLTVDKITNFKQDLPIQVFFVDSKGTNLSEYRVSFGYKGTSASNYIQSFKVPVNTASITVRFSATVIENTLPEFTVEFDNARLYYGKAKLLVGTPSSPNGEHSWSTLDGYLIDTTLMISFPEERRVELGYITEKEIAPQSARILSEYDTYENELSYQYIKK